MITAELDPRSGDPIHLCAHIADQRIDPFFHPCVDRPGSRSILRLRTPPYNSAIRPIMAMDATAEDPGDVMSMVQGMGEQLDEFRYEDSTEERKVVAA